MQSWRYLDLSWKWFFCSIWKSACGRFSLQSFFIYADPISNAIPFFNFTQKITFFFLFSPLTHQYQWSIPSPDYNLKDFCIYSFFMFCTIPLKNPLRNIFFLTKCENEILVGFSFSSPLSLSVPLSVPLSVSLSHSHTSGSSSCNHCHWCVPLSRSDSKKSRKKCQKWQRLIRKYSSPMFNNRI